MTTTTTKGRLDMRWVIHSQNRARRRARRINPPMIRLWDGDWNLRGRISNAISGSFEWKLNDTGAAVIELPLEHYLSKWIINVDDRTRNVHITMDKDGARWGGRLKTAVVQYDDSGVEKLVCTFNHDYEELRYILAWCNPFLPVLVQFPRTFLLAGPSRYMLKLALFCNLLRLNANLWNLPDDPLNPAAWVSGLDMSTWSIVVKPHDLLSDSSLWTVVHSRFKNWADMAADTLDDAQLMVECRRWLTGDPLPWPGFTPRNGALVVDIVDKSGYYTGTGTGGNIFDGFTRTIANFADDFMTETLDSITDPVDDSQYTVSNWMGTLPQAPWIVLRTGNIRSPIKTSSFTITPATAIQIVCGGHSPYGINEGISMAIQSAGGALGATFGFSALGNVIDTIARPLYTDTILAWMAYKHIIRAQHAGWSHYHEWFAEGADRAYTLSSLLVLRTGIWATRSRFAHEITIDAGAIPWMVGDQGQGHFFLGDRIGSTLKGAPAGKVFVDQVTALTYSFDRASTPGWNVVIGDRKDAEEPQARLLRKVRDFTSALQDLGVL